jgi:hypothetical protein
MSGPLETAREHWGADLPDWVEVLALECGRSSANKVAELLDRSPAVISQVLRKKYTADTSRFEERVRGVFLDAKVACPATGEMPLQECQDWREKASDFVLGNPTRVRMYRACNLCPRQVKEVPQ